MDTMGNFAQGKIKRGALEWSLPLFHGRGILQMGDTVPRTARRSRHHSRPPHSNPLHTFHPGGGPSAEGSSIGRYLAFFALFSFRHASPPHDATWMYQRMDGWMDGLARFPASQLICSRISVVTTGIGAPLRRPSERGLAPFTNASVVLPFPFLSVATTRSGRGSAWLH